MEEGTSKILLKGLTQAFLNTPPEEEPVVEKKEPSRKTRAEKRHSPSASEVAASIRKNMSFASRVAEGKPSEVTIIAKEEKQELKVAACSDVVVYSAPMVHKINMTENGFMKKIPACKKAEPMKRPADETLIIAAKKSAASKHIQTPSETAKADMAKAEKPEAKAEVKTAAKSENKTETKAVENKAKGTVKKEAVKKAVEKNEATKKEVAKKEIAKKEVTKKETVKKAATVKPAVEIQYNNNSYNVADIENKAEALWVSVSGKKVSDLKEMDLYIKPEDGKVYCVFNKNVNADFNI